MLAVWLAPVLVAPIAGSFLGVLVMRLPAGRPVAMARSACDSCGAVLAARDLVPVLSYLVLRGRCRRCRSPIGAAHLGIEVAALLIALLVVAIGATAPPGDLSSAWLQAWLWSGCVLGWGLLALGLIDWRCFRLPDVLTLPLLLLGLASGAVLDPDDLGDRVGACVVGWLAFVCIGWTYRRLRGREGLGAGDAKLLAAGGAWVGLAGLPLLVLLGAVATIGIALIRDRGRLRAEVPVPFGPGLCAALWAIWLWSTASVPVPG